ncbi:hypothetical protein ABZ642_45530 [Streptomyces sp. NPDC007157]|uniref:hypothetical protein n=1 Tax=Streptomyces sp. NPDC007157 TaxID=3154681 RepID=UPI0033F6F56E
MAHNNSRAGESAPGTPVVGTDSPSGSGPARFGMPHALVVLGFLAAAVVLRLVSAMSVRDTIALLAGAGGLGVAVLLATSLPRGSGSRGLLRRLLSAAFPPGPGN